MAKKPSKSNLTATKLLPPMAERKLHEEFRHGETVVDHYYWLREKKNPEVLAYLKSENAYTKAVTKPLQSFAKNLYNEILSRIKQTDLSVPIRDGNYFYFQQTLEGAQYPIYFRKKLHLDAPEEILLDLNEMAKGHDFFEIGDSAITDDDHLLAYTVDTTGYRQYKLQIKDLRTGKLIDDTAERVTSIVWAADNKTLFFVTENNVTKRSDTLWRLTLGEKPILVYQEVDELYYLEISDTKDRAYLLLDISSTDTTETRFLKTTHPQEEFQIFHLREKNHKYDVEHRNNVFYIRTNLDAKNFRIAYTSVSNTASSHWNALVSHDSNVLIEEIEMFQDFAVLHEKSEALARFRIYSFANQEWHTISFPETTYLAAGGSTPEFTAKQFRLSYESMITPSAIYDYDMDTRERTLLKQDEVLGGYEATRYHTERLWVTARDGMQIPLSIVYKKEVERNGKAPLLLYGYGAYGLGEDAHFSHSRLSLLDRGGIYVVAHVRGGDDLGESWHDNGMLMHKKNTFYDFIDSAEYLIANGWTSAEKIMIEGGSAGGLLIGSVVNMRPDLFGAAHLEVPFVDVMNTMFDESLPLTVGEYLEWGDPRDKVAYEYMKSYSPYDNIECKDYPAILVTTSLHDSQVMYWEAAKYVAKLRYSKTDRNQLLLLTNMSAGHGGASGRYDLLKEVAFEYAWLMHQVGIQE